MPGSVQCFRGCGTRVKFDDNYLSPSGKKIPLDANTGEPHQCPNNTFNQKNKSFPTKQDTQQLRSSIQEESEKQLKFADHAEQIDSLLQAILLYVEQQDKKIDKILEALTITTKAEFKPAADLKTDNGNEISGSDFSSGSKYVEAGVEEDNAVQDTG
jgi:hypothetical protein